MKMRFPLPYFQNSTTAFDRECTGLVSKFLNAKRKFIVSLVVVSVLLCSIRLSGP